MSFFEISVGIFVGFWLPLVALVFIVAKYGDKILALAKEVEDDSPGDHLRKRIMMISNPSIREKAAATFQEALVKGDTATLALIGKRVTDILKEEKHGMAGH